MSRNEAGKQGFVGWINQLIPLRRLGWAFLLAWVFCIFYTGVVEGYTGKIEWILTQGGLGLRLLMNVLPVSMSILMLIVIVGSEKFMGSPTEHRSVFWLAPLLTALSTPMLFWSFGDHNLAVGIFAVGSLLTGIGSGLMWVMWGEYYARISQELVERLAPTSAIIAAILVLILSAMSGWVAVLVVTLFPLLSGACFFLVWKDLEQGVDAERIYPSDKEALEVAHDKAKRSPIRVIRDMGRTGLGILVACLFTCLVGSVWNETEANSLAFQAILLLSILFTAVIALASTMGPRRITISFLYRWMCPALVIAFVSLIVFDPEVGGYLAFTISVAARFAFCLITQMYFARYAAQGRATAVQSFGLGWLFVHLGDCLGVFFYYGAQESMAAGVLELPQISAIAIGALVVITMFVLNDEKSFSAEKPDRMQALSTEFEEDSKENAFGEESKEKLGARIERVASKYELTPRETEVLDLLARGRSVPYVRDALFISKETAATHVKHIYTKLGVHSRQELIDLVN